MTVPQRRSTRQRSAVSAILDEADGFLSAQELHARLRSRGDAVGLATVYRALQALAEDGDVDVLRTDDGEAVYRRCSSGHHHHLVCRRCGRTVEVEGPAVETWARRVGAEHGFVDVQHVVEVFGICGPCASQLHAQDATEGDTEDDAEDDAEGPAQDGARAGATS